MVALLYIRRMLKKQLENRTYGVHYYDIGTEDGRAACGYTPTSPSDPLLTYAMSGASCPECRKAINDYIEGLKNTPARPHPVPVAALVLAERTGSC